MSNQLKNDIKQCTISPDESKENIILFLDKLIIKYYNTNTIYKLYYETLDDKEVINDYLTKTDTKFVLNCITLDRYFLITFKI